MYIALMTLISLLMVSIGLCSSPHKPSAAVDHPSLNQCRTSSNINNQALFDTIKRYFNYISDSELPVIVVQELKDTTFYYVTAIISTNAIKRNVPTAIITDLGREALWYKASKPRTRISPSCQHDLINKYKTILHADKTNTQQGLPHNAPDGFTYDPVLVRIALVGDQPKTLMTKVGSIPYFRY